MDYPKKGKQINQEGFLGKVTQAMLNDNIAKVEKDFEQEILRDPQAAKIIIQSLELITQSFSEQKQKGKSTYVAKDPQIEMRNKEIITRLQNASAIKGEGVVELRELADKLAKEMKIPISNETLQKAYLMDWFSDNLEKIEAHLAKQKL